MSAMEAVLPSRVLEVERLLQVLAVLRHHDLPVTRTALLAAVHAYGCDESDAKAVEALEKMVRNDMKRLRELGFRIDVTSQEGTASSWVLRPTPWRVPLQLDAQEDAVLAWVARMTDRDAAASAGVAPELLQTRLTSLTPVPDALGVVHAALSGGRALVVEKQGRERVIEPAQLAAFEGRWYLLARDAGSSEVKGFRLDRLVVLRLGDVLPVAPERVADPRAVLDPTGWDVDPPVEVELRCSPADLEQVSSWFARAEVVEGPDEVVLTFPATHHSAVIDRVIGLAGAARLVGPALLVEQLRTRLLPFTGGAA